MRPRSRSHNAARIAVTATLTLVAALSFSLATNIQSASADECDDLEQQIEQDFRLLEQATSAVERSRQFREFALATEDVEVARRYERQIETNETLMRQRQREVSRHAREWRFLDCDDDDDLPPPPGVCVRPETFFSLALRGLRRGSNSGGANRAAIRDAAEAAAALEPISGPNPIGVRVGPGGVLLNPQTGAQIPSPNGAGSIQVTVGPGGVDIGDIFTMNSVQVQPQASPPITLFQLSGLDGRPVVNQPPPPGTPAGAWASWASTYFMMDGRTTRAVGLSVGAAVLAPLVRAALMQIGRAAATFVGFTLLRLISALDPPAGCEYNIQIAYQSQPQGSVGRLGAVVASGVRSKLQAFDFAPTPPDTSTPTPPPSDDADTGSGGSGNGSVGINASTCNGVRGPWEVRIFSGIKDDGTGNSLSYTSNLGTSWTSPVPSSIRAFTHSVRSNEIDLNSRETRDIWTRVKADFKTRATAMVASSRGRLIDPDGFGRGRPTRIELEGGLAPGQTRKTLQAGCHISTPTGYSDKDLPF